MCKTQPTRTRRDIRLDTLAFLRAARERAYEAARACLDAGDRQGWERSSRTAWALATACEDLAEKLGV
jgi:hypothetical protein